MTVNPERQGSPDSLEEIRHSIDNVDESIIKTIKVGVSRGMGEDDLGKYLPESIVSAYEGGGADEEDNEENGADEEADEEHGVDEEPDEERGADGENNKKIDADQKTDWVSTFGELLFKGFQSAGHTSNSMAELIVARSRQNMESLTDDELQRLLALYVQTRAGFAVDAGREKWHRGLEIFDEKRETDIKNWAGQHSRTARHVMERVIEVCRELQELELGITNFEKDVANGVPENENGDTYPPA